MQRIEVGILTRPFPFFLNDQNKNVWLIGGTSIFVSLFLGIYMPFENSTHTLTSNIGWGVLCFFTLYLNIILLPKLLPGVFDLTEWTVLKYILFSMWLFVFMGVLFSVVNSLLYCSDMVFSAVLFKTMREVTFVGVIPLIIITVLARNALLNNNLADAVAVNRMLDEIRSIKEQAKQPADVFTIEGDNNERFSLNLKSLVYVAALDNYCEIYFRDKDAINVKVLRVTLKRVESQLGNQFMIRCHRSYLINIREIESISGNTNGYRLRMKQTEIDIPVSRAKGKEIIAHIEQICDLMDIMD